MNNVSRAVAGVLVGAAALSCLTGCSVPDRAAARLGDDGMVFVICDEYLVKELRVSTRLDRDDDWLQTWWATGLMQTGATSEIVYGFATQGMTSKQEIAPLDVKNYEIKLWASSIDHLRGMEVPTTTVAYFDGSKLEATKWLDQNGDLQDEPCP